MEKCFPSNTIISFIFALVKKLFAKYHLNLTSTKYNDILYLGSKERVLGDDSLGALSVDIHKQEREYRDFSLSDESVLRYLILFRSKVDITTNIDTNINIHEAGDIFDMNQEVIAMYASLDELIGKTNLKDEEIQMLKLLFEGNTISDVFQHHKTFSRMKSYRLVDRIIKKLKNRNTELWKESIKKQLEYKNEK